MQPEQLSVQPHRHLCYRGLEQSAELLFYHRMSQLDIKEAYRSSRSTWRDNGDLLGLPKFM